MKKFSSKITWAIFLTIALVSFFTQPRNSYMSGQGSQPSIHSALAATDAGVVITLPFVSNRYPLNTIFGIQLESSSPGKGLDQIISAKSSWVRQHALLWSEIEFTQGERNWGVMADMDAALIKAANAGIETVLIVHGTPPWAQSIAGATCSRIKVDMLPAFAAFMYDAVSRYSKPPFNIEYWEIWNEPDVPYTVDLATSQFGCWGDKNDKYFGGDYYTQMLKLVYPAIKSANPNAKVLVGGLLLDCDPRGTPSYCDKVGNPENPPRYLEGILLSGGGSYFDGVSFHAYDYFPDYAPALGKYSNANWGAAWNTTGPVSSLKAQFIREVLSKYAVTNKLLINTEAAVICGRLPTDPGCESVSTSLYEQTKANYVAQVYGVAIKDQLKANIWYSLFGWRNSGLLNQDLTPRPAFTAYESSRAVLRDATYKQAITSYPGVRILEFQRGAHIIWLAWSLDGLTHPITLTTLPKYITSHLGETIPPTTTIDITLSPIYIDWYP